jgi:hypothetical protein
MDKKVFIHTFLPAAEAAGVAYQINPNIILAQAYAQGTQKIVEVASVSLGV